MNEKDPNNIGTGDLHPRHKSWARLSVRSNMIGIAILLIMIVLVMAFTGFLNSILRITSAIILIIAAVIIIRSNSIQKKRPVNSTEQMIIDAWKEDPRVNENVISVHISGGIAYLSGRQETVQARQAAAEIAANAPGVERVSNGIEVIPSV